jgi:hypothetical protein
MKQRRAEPLIIYQGTDISRDIAPYLLSLTYSDHAEGRADDLELELEDRDELWSTDWYPVKGDSIEAFLNCYSWGDSRASTTLRCGKFEVDEISFSGPPAKVRITAHSAKVTQAMKEKRTRSWENTDLPSIAAQIASKHVIGTLLQLDSPPDYTRVDQTEQSDLEFLQRLCKPHNLYVKIAEDRLIISTQESLERVLAGSVQKSEVIRWSFRDKTHKIYKACKVTYWDPETKQEYSYTQTDSQAPATGDTLVVNGRVEGLSKAVAQAKTELERANKWELTGSLTVHGRVELVAGVSVQLSGFGAISGQHFVEHSTHTYSRSGYKTKLGLRSNRND